MLEPHAEIVRAAAARLAGTIDPALPQLTERVLSAGPGREVPGQYFDPGIALGLASLLVSVAGLAWNMGRASREKGQPLSAEVMSRRIRVQLADDSELLRGVSDEQRDRIVEVVVEETISYGGGAAE